MFAAGVFEPFEYQFFNNGLVVATLAGALCGLLGVFVVLRGMSYIGHGLSHAVFGGAAASAVMQLNYFVGAGIWGVASGVIIGRIARRKLIGADAAIGVVTTASFALGLALLNRYGQAKKSIEAVLFGSVLGVETADIIAVSAVSVLTAVIIFALYRHFLFATFDPEVAQTSGVKVAWIEALLMAMLSLTILVTMRVIGTLLISALLVIPASVARELAADGKWKRFITDPQTGNLLDYGRQSYEPPQALIDFLIARDRTCRFPGCRRSAALSDIDHAQSWETGGRTSPDNLGALCRRHHRLKTHDGWTVESREDGSCTWTSPLGKIYLTPARPIGDAI
jgi:manganese/iron transport system permease protein/iron/zinc/copper transport system permease protein